MKLFQQTESIYLLYLLPVQIRLRKETEDGLKKNQKHLHIVLYPKRANCNRYCCRRRAVALLVPMPPISKLLYLVHGAALSLHAVKTGGSQAGSAPGPVGSAEREV